MPRKSELAAFRNNRTKIITTFALAAVPHQSAIVKICKMERTKVMMLFSAVSRFSFFLGGLNHVGIRNGAKGARSFAGLLTYLSLISQERVAIINAKFQVRNAATTNVQNRQISNPPTPLPT